MFGNRTVSSAGGAPSRQFDGGDFARTNRLYAPGDTSLPMNQRHMRYDAAGNLTYDDYSDTKSAGGREYDAENRMTSAWGGDPVSGTYQNFYSYDGDGRRVKSITGSGGKTTVFVYDAAEQLVAEYASSTAQPNGTQYLTADNLGTPRVVTNAQGGVVSRHDYFPFGEEIGVGVGGRTQNQGYVGSADGNRKRWAKLERDDETGLDYAQARYYSNTQGRFTSVDPFSIILDRQKAPNDEKTETAFKEFLGNPQRWNHYAYAVNTPTVFTDPTGLDIMIIENHSTGITSNPIGHTAIAITGRGVYSSGNARDEPQATENKDIVGGSVEDYIRRELPKRDTTLIIIKTTPQQDAAAAGMLEAIAGSGVQLEAETITLDNCSIRVNKALDAAGIEGVQNLSPALPGSAGARAIKDGGLGGAADVIDIPKNSNLLASDLKTIKQFEPRSPVPRPGTAGGTPVVTMPMRTEKPRRRHDE